MTVNAKRFQVSRMIASTFAQFKCMVNMAFIQSNRTLTYLKQKDGFRSPVHHTLPHPAVPNLSLPHPTLPLPQPRGTNSLYHKSQIRDWIAMLHQRGYAFDSAFDSIHFSPHFIAHNKMPPSCLRLLLSRKWVVGRTAALCWRIKNRPNFLDKDILAYN